MDGTLHHESGLRAGCRDTPKAGIGRGIGGTGPRRWLAWLARWRRGRAAIGELRALDAHMLDDIGVTRDEIETVVRRGRPVRHRLRTAPGRTGKNF